MRRLSALAAVVAALFGAFYFAVRPWYVRRGATDAEVHGRLPGDQIVPNVRPADTVTRAITIDAPSWRVWQWRGRR